MVKGILITLIVCLLQVVCFSNSVTAQTNESSKSVYVFISFSEVCPLCIELVPTLNEIIEKNTLWCEFTLVLPNNNLSQKKLSTLLQAFKHKPKLVYDSTKKVCKQFGFTVTPEIVVENDNNEILYSGAIDDRFIDFGKTKKHSITPYLASALEEIFEGKKPSIVSTKAFGCYISYSKSK
jgi:thiol-disulfide isomerase/thioredoxin